jgi:ankyrin repeat protein
MTGHSAWEEVSALHFLCWDPYRSDDKELAEEVQSLFLNVDVNQPKPLPLGAITLYHLRDSLLNLASESGKVKMVQFLLQNHANVNQQADDGVTPLYGACKHSPLHMRDQEDVYVKLVF